MRNEHIRNVVLDSSMDAVIRNRIFNMGDVPMTLSDKGWGPNSKKVYYHEKDVRDFIKKLKKDYDELYEAKIIDVSALEGLYMRINERAGEKLI